jgi:hypothetical protein
MNRAPGALLTPEDTGAPQAGAPAGIRRGLVRRTLAGLGHSCALVGVALLGCLALVAVGTVGSLAWTFLVER